MRYLPKFDRRLCILLASQALAGSTVPVLFLISGLLGPKISPSLEISTLPVTLVVVGIALGSAFVGKIMGRLGRKNGHIAGLALTMIGIAIAYLALTKPNFYLYCVGAFVTGTGCSLNNQVRFTAADFAAENKALVHSWILMSGLFAAIIGPGVAEYGRELSSVGEYTGSLAILFFMLAFVAMLFLIFFPPTPSSRKQENSGSIALPQILSQKKFWQACLPGLASFVTMTLLMTATPIEMHHHHHISHGDTTSAIRAHIIAMYFPSLFGGLLIAWLGLRRLIAFSVAIFAVCIAIGYSNQSLHGFTSALILLGIGWNFLFLAGSTAISQSYQGPERFTAQAANDTLVYGVQALASLAAGWLIFHAGWKTVVLLPVPILVAVIAIYLTPPKYPAQN